MLTRMVKNSRGKSNSPKNSRASLIVPKIAEASLIVPKIAEASLIIPKIAETSLIVTNYTIFRVLQSAETASLSFLASFLLFSFFIYTSCIPSCLGDVNK